MSDLNLLKALNAASESLSAMAKNGFGDPQDMLMLAQALEEEYKITRAESLQIMEEASKLTASQIQRLRGRIFAGRMSKGIHPNSLRSSIFMQFTKTDKIIRYQLSKPKDQRDQQILNSYFPLRGYYREILNSLPF